MRATRTTLELSALRWKLGLLQKRLKFQEASTEWLSDTCKLQTAQLPFFLPL